MVKNSSNWSLVVKFTILQSTEPSIYCAVTDVNLLHRTAGVGLRVKHFLLLVTPLNVQNQLIREKTIPRLI